MIQNGQYYFWHKRQSHVSDPMKVVLNMDRGRPIVVDAPEPVDAAAVDRVASPNDPKEMNVSIM